jgi:hypothetical protein
LVLRLAALSGITEHLKISEDAEPSTAGWEQSMKVQSRKLVYFSPTGTTKAVVQGISRGINQYLVEILDITRPDARKKPLQTSENELLVIAVPVYMGRVPALLMEWLQAIKAQKTPVVCCCLW